MQRHRITIALGVALAGHVGALWWWSERPAVEVNLPATQFELVFTQVSRADERVQPDQEIEEFKGSEVLPEPPAELSPEPDVLSQTEIPNEPPSAELDMTRPDGWAEVAPSLGTPEDFARAFRGDFYQRLEQRKISQTRSQLLAARRISQRGLPADQYNALQRPGSGHYKTAAGCFDLKSDIVGAIGAGQRAWITGCKDLIRSPFEHPPVEFDAFGRMVAP